MAVEHSVRRRWLACVAGVVSVSVGALSCGSNSAGQVSHKPVIGPSGQSSPFSVGRPPPGRLVVAGTGDDVLYWGEDGGGTDEPFTLLVPEGEPVTSGRAVTVSVTGYARAEGGLAQMSPGYAGAFKELRIGGHRALFTAARCSSKSACSWADLLVDLGHDLAVRATGRRASLSLLEQMVSRARPNGQRRAPNVMPVPAGWRAVGSIGSEVAVGFRSYAAPNSDHVPGPSSAHSAAWVRDGQATTMLMTFPGRSADLDALAGRASFDQVNSDPTLMRVAGRPAVILDNRSVPLARREKRSLFTTLANGDVLAVFDTGRPALGDDDLIALAASVRATSNHAWRRFVGRALGGPGLHPDPTGIEIQRGKAAGTEWLLQAVPPDELRSRPTPGTMSSSGRGAAPPDRLVIDSCLKLATLQRACPLGGGGSSLRTGADLSYQAGHPTRRHGEADFPSFMVVDTSSAEATNVRIRTTTRTVQAALRPIPGTSHKAAVLFVKDDVFSFHCQPPSPGWGRLELVNATGRVIACS